MISLNQVASEDLIHAAVTNDVHKMASILKSGAVHVDVCERGGHTPLFAAAVSPTLAIYSIDTPHLPLPPTTSPSPDPLSF